MKKIIQTDNAPQAIGTYSQGVLVNNTLYVSGQIPLNPDTMQLVSKEFRDQAHQVFKNLKAVIEAAGGDVSKFVKLTIFLTDLSDFPTVNEVMSEYFSKPYPARSAVEISALPKSVKIEIEGIADLS